MQINVRKKKASMPQRLKFEIRNQSRYTLFLCLSSARHTFPKEWAPDSFVQHMVLKCSICHLKHRSIETKARQCQNQSDKASSKQQGEVRHQSVTTNP